jgi:hypothetical protein
MRAKAFTDLLLQPPLGAVPGVGRDLGSNYYLHHWLRVRPLFQYGAKLKIVGEVDIPFGMFAGQNPVFVSEARDSYETRRGYDVHPRKLYLEYLTPIGLVRAGHQTSHWGMGLLANDGDHPSLFGDYRRGSIVERVLFATRPLGSGHPFVVALAADFVFEDNTADVVDEGDRAAQAVLASASTACTATRSAGGKRPASSRPSPRCSTSASRIWQAVFACAPRQRTPGCSARSRLPSSAGRPPSCAT